MPKVRFKTCLSGFNFRVRPGEIIDMEEGEAARHVAKGHAVYIDPPAPKVPPPPKKPIERMVSNPPTENMTSPRAPIGQRAPGIRRINK